jgi:hypothetical protein
MRNATALPRAGMPLSANGANTNGANANGTAPATCEPRPLPASPFSSGCSTSSRRPRARCSEFSAAYPSP